MNIGILSYRIAGTDGVSLELERWGEILTRRGHQVTMIAGELDRSGYLLPWLSFNHPLIYELHDRGVKKKVPFKKIRGKVFKLVDIIEREIDDLFDKLTIERLIVMNVFSLPIHFGLAPALDRVIRKRKMITFSRSPDFWWERQRYGQLASWQEFFKRYFPPADNPYITHITSNKLAQKALKQKYNLQSVICGDTFDYKNVPRETDKYASHWREDLGIGKDKKVFLQATRIVPRKQIELAIELVYRLGDKNNVLVLAGYSGDEGDDYLQKLKRMVKEYDIEAYFIGHRVGARRRYKNGQRIYTLWDCFVNSDVVTYPSAIEGFGNQFIEAINFGKPIVVNRYPVYKSDLEPLGFKTIAIDNKITEETLRQVRRVLRDDQYRQEMATTNLQIAKKYFSFEATEEKLKKWGF